MKIHVMDPGLKTAGGHEHDWDTRIANYLVTAGHDVAVYVHAQAQPAVLRGFAAAVSVKRLFSINPYLGGEFFDPICGEIQRQLVGATTVAKELKTVERADLWVWPTAFAYQLRGCALADIDVAMSFCLHTPPEIELGLFEWTESGGWWRVAAKSLQGASRRIATIGSIEAECFSSFLPFIGELGPVHLPMPFDGTPSRRTQLKTVGILGAYRDDQGSPLIGNLVARCLQAGFKVVVQADRVVPPALRDNADVTVTGYDGIFADKVERCDLVVAPYRADKYSGGRGSGVIWQAIASGVPCVAPRYSTPGRTLAGIGSASFFSELSIAGISEAICDAQNSYSSLADAAFRGAIEYRRHNGLAKFVDAMLPGAPSQK